MALDVYYKSDIKNRAAGIMYGVDELALFVQAEIDKARHQDRDIDPNELEMKIDAWYSGYKTALGSNAISFGL